jgi:hypothetical protein
MSMFSRADLRVRTVFTATAAGALAASLSLAGLGTGPATGAGPAFSNTPLIATWTLPSGYSTSPIANSTGNSEPAIAFGPDGQMAVDGLAWLPFQVNLWQGQFGSTPDYFGAMDTMLPKHGKGRTALGDGDADVTITDAGTTLLTDLDFFVNPPFTRFQLGVSVTRCPAGATGPGDCTTALLDQAGADRPWITTDGTTAYVSYHDSQSSSLIRVMKSTDDGRTWHHAASPITALGGVTGSATSNNQHGPIVADPTTGDVFQVFAAGEPQTKGHSADYNNIYVARSTNGARSWSASRVFHAPRGTQLANLFPALTVDTTTGTVWAAWTDLHGVSVASSTDHGRTWSDATTVSTARTTVMPWVAARDGKVDVVYYATSASSPDDESAVWNTYDSQLQNGAWNVLKVSNTPNRVGAVCLEGSECAEDRQLLDLFEVAEDPISGKAAVIYTDSTLNTYTDPSGQTHELPEIVLAFEN